MSCPHPCSSAPSPPPSPSPSPPPPPRGRLSTLRRSRSAARILVHSGARESPAISPPSRPRAPHWYFEDPEILSPLSHLRHGTCDYLNDLMDLRFLYDLELERLEVLILLSDHHKVPSPNTPRPLFIGFSCYFRHFTLSNRLSFH
eukprot:TRINITY_DN45_c0_g1_i6.p1 TRINITY_DN45_c0_g1~~TRINITY_DN45_c0_g1_i6.p1  ORF type:complete len:145 (+),score=24.53 TRINITY_DN45_c0_g1_i6:206-640(+)